VVGNRGWSYFFIDLRRRYVNDRIWFGGGLTAAAFGNLGAEDFQPAWLLVSVGLAGLGLIAWGWVRR
jgi:hypothetical protein